MASPAPQPLTPDEEREFEEARVARLTDTQVRWGMLFGALFCVFDSFLLPRVFPAAPWSRTGAAAWGGAAACLLYMAVSYLPSARTTVGTALVGTLFRGVLCAALGLVGSATGGMDSPVLPTTMLVWIVIARSAPVRPKVFALASLLDLSLLFGVALAGAPEPRWSWLPFWLLTWGAIFTGIGAAFRERTERRAFAAQRRLDQLNAQLESRVQEQVTEITTRAREVEALNEQLRLKVSERSRELAEALKRLAARPGTADALEPGMVVGERARIVRRLGGGGMGTVYLADDRVTGGPVALKLLTLEVGAGPRLLRRFVAEAALAAAVSHPAVVKTLHVDVTSDGRLYQLMEYVEGVTLEERVRRGPASAGEAARLLGAIAEALAAAHRAGIVHRDIKPSNVMLCASAPGLRVLDFGISKALSPDAGDEALTRTHQFVGTPAYMAPEQARDPGGVTGASDVYSLGVVGYELLGGGRFTALCGAGGHDAPRPLGEVAPAVPPSLEALVHACLAAVPDDRPAAETLARELGRLADALGAPTTEELGRRAALLPSAPPAGPAPAETQAATPAG